MILDVMKFLLFFAAIFVAFVVGLSNLYLNYNSIQEEMSIKNKSKTENINENFLKFVIRYLPWLTKQQAFSDNVKATNLIF